MSTRKEKRGVFRSLHIHGCFVLPNPWDIGSARLSASDAIDRLVALADAGADCLYAPGIGMASVDTNDDVIAPVKAVAPKPVNILVVGPGIALTEYADIGVRRISVGGALAQVSFGAAFKAAKQLKEGHSMA
jgi:2-methylisocitrate lyase-like PEP mutase family enzyme